MVILSMQIVNWRTHLKFPEEAKLSAEAKDLICKLLCNVEQRLGTKGAYEIKVSMHHNSLSFCSSVWKKLTLVFLFRHTHGLKGYNGINYIRWKLHFYQRLTTS